MRQKTTDRSFNFERIVRYGGLVWVHYTEAFTLQSPLLAPWAFVPWSHFQLPTEVRGEGVIIARIKNGEFAEWWEYGDYPLVTYVPGAILVVPRNGVCTSGRAFPAPETHMGTA